MTKITEESLKNCFDAILKGAKERHKKEWGTLVEAIKDLDAEQFYFQLIYPLHQSVDANHKNNKASWIYLHWNYIEGCFTRYIVDREGSACSVDKSRHIVRCLYKFFENGEDFSLERNENGEYGEYWKPKCIDKAWALIFFDACMGAYYGNHTKLMQFYLANAEQEKSV